MNKKNVKNVFRLKNEKNTENLTIETLMSLDWQGNLKYNQRIVYFNKGVDFNAFTLSEDTCLRPEDLRQLADKLEKSMKRAKKVCEKEINKNDPRAVLSELVNTTLRGCYTEGV